MKPGDFLDLLAAGSQNAFNRKITTRGPLELALGVNLNRQG